MTKISKLIRERLQQIKEKNPLVRATEIEEFKIISISHCTRKSSNPEIQTKKKSRSLDQKIESVT